MSTILVTGSASGLGAAIVTALKTRHDVIPYDAVDGRDVLEPPKFISGKLDVLINCAGINRINWLENVTDIEWDAIMDVNVKGIFKMSKACLPELRDSKGTIINIVSNAAHIPMRCSAAYNASKGAALILTKQMARELSPDITVFSISPNRLADTAMSRQIDEQVVDTRGWTLEEARAYQLQSLLAKEETPTYVVADFIAYLLQDKMHHKFLTGCDIPYGA